MSTLRVNAIVNAAGANTATLNGALPVLDTAPGLAKAWVNFNGTGTVAIRASHNVTSITDGGVGLYQMNFATNFADTNYATVFGLLEFDTSNTNQSGKLRSLAVSSVSIKTVQGNTAGTADFTGVYVAVFR